MDDSNSVRNIDLLYLLIEVSMEFLGKGLAFAALVAAATALELNGKEADGLWFLVVIWVIFGSWQHSKKRDCKDETE